MAIFGKYLYKAFIVGLSSYLAIMNSVWWILLLVFVLMEYKD